MVKVLIASFEPDEGLESEINSLIFHLNKLECLNYKACILYSHLKVPDEVSMRFQVLKNTKTLFESIIKSFCVAAQMDENADYVLVISTNSELRQNFGIVEEIYKNKSASDIEILSSQNILSENSNLRCSYRRFMNHEDLRIPNITKIYCSCHGTEQDILWMCSLCKNRMCRLASSCFNCGQRFIL